MSHLLKPLLIRLPELILPAVTDKQRLMSPLPVPALNLLKTPPSPSRPILPAWTTATPVWLAGHPPTQLLVQQWAAPADGRD